MQKNKLRLYPTASQPCAYLPGYLSRNLVVDVDTALSAEVYELLLAHNFRRSGNRVYRPDCPSCEQCKNIRVPVEQFVRSRGQRRVWSKNKDLVVEINHTGQIKQEYNQLYKDYLYHRHNRVLEDDAELLEFVHNDWMETVFIEFRLNNALIALAISDVLPTGLSAVYTVYQPVIGKFRSLGVYAVLWQLKHLEDEGLPYLHLGYWIKDCDKMNYKNNYQPAELLHANKQWKMIGK